MERTEIMKLRLTLRSEEGDLYIREEAITDYDIRFLQGMNICLMEDRLLPERIRLRIQAIKEEQEG